MTKLYLCEKPSQARDIAAVLGAPRKGDGFIETAGGTVTWALGHLLESAQPHDYDASLKKWSMAALPILPSQWRMTDKNKTRKQLMVIGKLLKSCDHVVVSTDADREGEVIAREVLTRFGYQGSIDRLWLSALDASSIRKALSNVLPGTQTEPLYQAGLARSRADWLVGMNLTRLFTLAANSDDVLSVGRVQTPTLWLVVDRDRAIEAFVSSPYWGVRIELESGSSTFTAAWRPNESLCDSEGRCTQQQAALNVAESSKGQVGRIVSTQTERKRKASPLPYALSALQLEASKRWGFGAQEVLKLAQSLYENHKVTTYPRTDCSYLPVSQHSEAPDVLATLSERDPLLDTLVQTADARFKSKVWNDAKITAHHAIIPTAAKAELSKLSQDERRLYDLVSRRYLAQFYPRYEFDETVVEISLVGETFRSTGRQVIAEGWRIVYRDQQTLGTQNKDEPQSLPDMIQEDSVQCIDSQVQDKKTHPPARFTEGSLVQSMKTVARTVEDVALKKLLKETSGIGTEATRGSIIETLIQRNYLGVEKKKYLKSTAKGRALIDVVPAAVKDPAMTALWEQSLEEIAAGRGSMTDFVARQGEWLTALIVPIKTSPEVVSAGLEDAAGPIHPCPECGSPMRRRKGKRSRGKSGKGRSAFFWGCSRYPDCGTTLPDSRGKPGKRTEPSGDNDKRKPVTVADESIQEGGQCPSCEQGVLVLRDIKKGKNAGSRFFGCSNYPTCKHFVWSK